MAVTAHGARSWLARAGRTPVDELRLLLRALAAAAGSYSVRPPQHAAGIAVRGLFVPREPRG